MKRIIVIGLGNFGSAVADALAGKGHDVIAVDLDEHAVERMATRVARAEVADGTDASALAEVGGDRVDVGVTGTGDDITASILAILALQDLETPQIYVKVISAAHARAVEKMGVTATVFPERDNGIRLGESLASEAVLNYVPRDEVTGVPDPDAPLKESDALFVAGGVEDLEGLPGRRPVPLGRARFPGGER